MYARVGRDWLGTVVHMASASCSDALSTMRQVTIYAAACLVQTVDEVVDEVEYFLLAVRLLWLFKDVLRGELLLLRIGWKLVLRPRSAWCIRGHCKAFGKRS